MARIRRRSSGRLAELDRSPSRSSSRRAASRSPTRGRATRTCATRARRRAASSSTPASWVSRGCAADVPRARSPPRRATTSRGRRRTSAVRPSRDLGAGRCLALVEGRRMAADARRRRGRAGLARCSRRRTSRGSKLNVSASRPVIADRPSWRAARRSHSPDSARTRSRRWRSRRRAARGRRALAPACWRRLLAAAPARHASGVGTITLARARHRGPVRHRARADPPRLEQARLRQRPRLGHAGMDPLLRRVEYETGAFVRALRAVAKR